MFFFLIIQVLKPKRTKTHHQLNKAPIRTKLNQRGRGKQGLVQDRSNVDVGMLISSTDVPKSHTSIPTLSRECSFVTWNVSSN